MVRSPLIVSKCEPLSHVRKEMLLNSYSFIPIYIEDKWQLISDYCLYNYLKTKNNPDSALRESVSTACQNGLQLVEPTRIVNEKESIKEINLNTTIPVLVHRIEEKNNLVGILTSFDLI